MSPLASVVVALAVNWGHLFNPFDSTPTPTRADVTQCLAQTEASTRRWRADGVFFCGRITPESLAAFREQVRATDRVVLIASLGGDLDAPLDMAEMVRDRGMHVIVVGPCLSGCASFVFVAARQRTVTAGGVLGVHNTSSSALVLARALREGELAARDRPLVERAARELEIYRSVNANPSLLIEPQVRLETLCLSEDQADPRTGETRYLIHSRYGLWVPTRSQWIAFGVAFRGTTPASRAQAQRLVNLSMPTNLLSGASVEFSTLPLSAPPEVFLSDVRACGIRRN